MGQRVSPTANPVHRYIIRLCCKVVLGKVAVEQDCYTPGDCWLATAAREDFHSTGHITSALCGGRVSLASLVMHVVFGL